MVSKTLTAEFPGKGRLFLDPPMWACASLSQRFKVCADMGSGLGLRGWANQILTHGSYAGCSKDLVSNSAIRQAPFFDRVSIEVMSFQWSLLWKDLWNHPS